MQQPHTEDVAESDQERRPANAQHCERAASEQPRAGQCRERDGQRTNQRLIERDTRQHAHVPCCEIGDRQNQHVGHARAKQIADRQAGRALADGVDVGR